MTDPSSASPLPPTAAVPKRPATTGTSTARRPKPLLLHGAAKPLLFVLCLLPFAWLVYGAVLSATGASGSAALGANPAEALIRATGDWTLRFLCITLTVTPLRQALGLPALIRFRRMLGLFTFFYGCLHFLGYSWLDMGLVWADIVHDIAKRPFILVGSSALLLMTPLALTSFNRAIKAMGVARWQALHRAIYAIALLGVLHFLWLRSAKSNYAEVSVYAGIVALLLGWRVVAKIRSSRRLNAAV